MSRNDNIDIQILSISPAPGVSGGFAIEAVIEGERRSVIAREGRSGTFFAEQTSEGMLPAVLRQRVRAVLTEHIENELGRELPREVRRHVKQEANKLIYAILSHRAARERLSLQAEAYEDLAAFRIKYAKELGA